MEGMKELFSISRPVTEEYAYQSPYLYISHKNNLKHIRVLSSGELVRMNSQVLPQHVRNFIVEHGEVIIIANIVKKYIVQLIIRGMKEKGFAVFSPTVVPFYGIGRMSSDFQYGQPVVLVEGVLDYESVHRYYPNVLSILTASLSAYQIDMLETLTNRVVFLLDNDEAGIRGKRKAQHKLLMKGFNCHTITLPPFQKDPGQIIEYEMEAKEYERSFAEIFLQAQLATKT